MRKRYHIKIDKDHIEQFENILNQQDIIPFDIMPISDKINGIIGRDYLVELSKYELLYIRLAAQSGKIIKLEGLGETVFHSSTGFLSN